MIKKFKTFNEAFDFCREKDCPVIVRIKNERWKLYPSGKAEKQSPSSNDGLGTKQNGELLIDCAKIIVQSTNPVKLITAQIRYRMLVAKMYRQNAKVK